MSGWECFLYALAGMGSMALFDLARSSWVNRGPRGGYRAKRKVNPRTVKPPRGPSGVTRP